MRTMNARGMSVLLFAGLLAGGTAAWADNLPLEDWQKIGNFSNVVAVAMAPSSPSRIMVSVKVPYSEAGGIYRSDNGGDDWTMASTYRPTSLAINPSDPNVVLMSTPPA